MREIINALPKGPIPHEEEEGGELYGANPEREFVGTPYSYDSFGVFNGPIRDVAEIFKSGNAVIAWFTTDLEEGIIYKWEWID